MSKKQYDVKIEVPPDLKLEQALRASLQLQAIGNVGEDAANIIAQFGDAWRDWCRKQGLEIRSQI